MKEHTKTFCINLFVASPVIVAFFTAIHFMDLVAAVPECSINAPRELPRCLPEEINEDTITSMQEADNGYYLACENHEQSTGKADKYADAKYVLAYAGAQP